MDNFDFYNPTKILFGKNRIEELDKEIPKKAKVLILYGGGSVKTHGTLDKVRKALKNRDVQEFSGIEPNPSYETLMKAIAVVKEEKRDFLLAVGGGSVIDGTKFIAVAANYPGENATELLLKPALYTALEQVLPIGTVLTLPATGSEMNMGAVITYNKGKYAVFNSKAYPKFSFLDPTLTYTLPKTQVANGIIDAYVHVCEQYVTYPANALFQDQMAEGILRNLITIGKTCIDEPTNYEMRANLMWNATMALNGLLRVGTPQDWSTHQIGHQLTASFGIDHAQTLAIVMPSLWEHHKKQKREKLIQYGKQVFHLQGTDDQIVDVAIEQTRAFFESLGVATKLSGHGVPKKALAKL
jgi:NADP-dependent alcohol dehydrogenase